MTDNGPVIINKSDFDPAIHTLYDAGEATVIPEPPLDENGLRLDGPTVAEYVQAGYSVDNYPPAGYASRSTAEEIAALKPTTAPVQPPAHVTPPPPPVPPVQPDDKPLVAQIGDRYFIVNVKGEKLAGKGISPTGYASNEKAWEAVTKLSE